MKHFIYTYSEKKPNRDGHVQKSVRIYKVSRNIVTLVAEATDQYVSEFQLVLETMERSKLLPKRAFKRSEVFGGMIICTPWAMREAGIADIRRIT